MIPFQVVTSGDTGAAQEVRSGKIRSHSGQNGGGMSELSWELQGVTELERYTS